MHDLLAWERLLWSGRSLLHHARYLLTDFRLVRIVGGEVQEIALHDVRDVTHTRTRLDRVLGTSTLVVRGRGPSPALILHGVRRGGPLAAALEILSTDVRAAADVTAIQDALSWDPRGTMSPPWEAGAAAATLVIALIAVVVGFGPHSTALGLAADDPIYPAGRKLTRAEIARFMDHEVMPWARTALGPIKGGPDRVTCLTCHGADADARGWQMPAVAALPQPLLRDEGWERYGGAMDAQMRNAIYGYLADSDRQKRAAYMRTVVMPGMAALLHRPPYDFTRSYDYNRSRSAFGCYHCHRVK